MNALQIVEDKPIALRQQREKELMALIKETYAKGATDEEVKFFAQVCSTQNLDPIKRQIYFTKIWDSSQNKSVFTPIVSIDGMRSKAEETGMYAGQTIPLFCGKDGVWKEIWTESIPPFAAKVGVFRKDFKDPIYAIAQFDAYAKKTKEGKLTKFWAEMGYLMLAKCAEALALRKALPQKLSGLYSEEERSKDTIDVDFTREEEKPNQFKSINPIQKNKEIIENSEKVFSAVQDFHGKKDGFMQLIEKKCQEELGKCSVDIDFESSFRHEMMTYLEEEFIKFNGKINVEELFKKKILAKRLNILASNYNLSVGTHLNDGELKLLKLSVYDEIKNDPSKNVEDIFAIKSAEFIPF